LKTIGAAEVGMRIVEMCEAASPDSADAALDRSGTGTSVRVAAALAAPRNSRREMRVVFMGTPEV
jgi:hypothetical protein